MVGGRVIVMKKILGTLIFSMLFCVNVFAEVKKALQVNGGKYNVVYL